MATRLLEPTQAALGFPQSLSEKYRPKTIGGFVGLEKPKRILANFAAKPRPMAFLFLGPSGTGKTTMALALAEQIGAELRHIPSQNCTVSAVEETVRFCWYVPRGGGFHIVLVDEADQMTPQAQLALLSKLDSTAAPPATIWVFTANATDRLADRFLSRLVKVDFSSYGLSAETTRLLERVWQAEAGDTPAPNLGRIVKESKNNVRDALMVLEAELLAS